MPDLFSNIPCPTCGRPHMFRDDSPVRRAVGSRYSYICPTTHRPGIFRSPQAEPVILCPAGTVPATWLPD